MEIRREKCVFLVVKVKLSIFNGIPRILYRYHYIRKLLLITINLHLYRPQPLLHQQTLQLRYHPGQEKLAGPETAPDYGAH